MKGKGFQRVLSLAFKGVLCSLGGFLLAESLDPKGVVSIEELAFSNMYEIEALIEVFARKGIVSKEEVLEEIKRMRSKMES